MPGCWHPTSMPCTCLPSTRRRRNATRKKLTTRHPFTRVTGAFLRITLTPPPGEQLHHRHIKSLKLLRNSLALPNSTNFSRIRKDSLVFEQRESQKFPRTLIHLAQFKNICQVPIQTIQSPRLLENLLLYKTQFS